MSPPSVELVGIFSCFCNLGTESMSENRSLVALCCPLVEVIEYRFGRIRYETPGFMSDARLDNESKLEGVVLSVALVCSGAKSVIVDPLFPINLAKAPARSVSSPKVLSPTLSKWDD